MTAAAIPKLTRAVGFGGAALFAGLVLGRAELVVVAVPLLVYAAAGVAMARPPSLRVAVELSAYRCLEGDHITATVGIECEAGCDDLEIGVVVPAGLEVVDGSARALLSLRPGQSTTHSLVLRAARWGNYRVGVVALRAFSPGRMLSFESVRDVRQGLRVYPRLETLAKAVVPPRTQVFAGNQVAPVAGSGIEFADVRQFSRGDRIRHVNWRVSSRGADVFVNVYHPERNADVVLFLDAFGDFGPAGTSSLDLTVRGAASLARHYLVQRDRVGLVGFGGILNWLTPSMGQTQFFRIVDYLLDVEATLSYAWKDVRTLPLRTLPPSALVIALTPLVDERALGALEDLSARGFPVVAIDVLPEHLIPAGADLEGRVAHRAWLLQRDALRVELGSAGVPVLAWSGRGSLAAVLAAAPDLRRASVRRWA